VGIHGHRCGRPTERAKKFPEAWANRPAIAFPCSSERLDGPNACFRTEAPINIAQGPCALHAERLCLPNGLKIGPPADRFQLERKRGATSLDTPWDTGKSSDLRNKPGVLTTPTGTQSPWRVSRTGNG